MMADDDRTVSSSGKRLLEHLKTHGVPAVLKRPAHDRFVGGGRAGHRLPDRVQYHHHFGPTSGALGQPGWGSRDFGPESASLRGCTTACNATAPCDFASCFGVLRTGPGFQSFVLHSDLSEAAMHVAWCQAPALILHG